jgi:hypothetical protein
VDDERQAVCGFLSLTQLADLADSGAYGQVSDLAGQLAQTLGESEGGIRSKLDRLLLMHRQEWIAFLEQHGATSFLSQWMSKRQ